MSQSRCNSQLQTCQGPPWKKMHLGIAAHYPQVLCLQCGSDFHLGPYRCYHNTERRGLYSAGRLPLSQQPLAVISVCFIDRPQTTSRKKYQSLPDKEAEAGKVPYLGHQADQRQAKNRTQISCVPEQFCLLHCTTSLL